MKNVLKLILISAFLMAGSAAYAQDIKFGHINSSRLINIMPEREAAERQLRQEAESLGQELENLQVEYNNKLQNFIEAEETLSPTVRNLRERELRELQTRIQEFQAGAQEDLQMRERELIQPIFERIQTVIAEVAKERGYIYVFDLDAQSVLYYSEDSEDIFPYVREKMGL